MSSLLGAAEDKYLGPLDNANNQNARSNQHALKMNKIDTKMNSYQRQIAQREQEIMKLNGIYQAANSTISNLKSSGGMNSLSALYDPHPKQVSQTFQDNLYSQGDPLSNTQDQSHSRKGNVFNLHQGGVVPKNRIDLHGNDYHKQNLSDLYNKRYSHNQHAGLL